MDLYKSDLGIRSKGLPVNSHDGSINYEAMIAETGDEWLHTHSGGYPYTFSQYANLMCVTAKSVHRWEQRGWLAALNIHITGISNARVIWTNVNSTDRQSEMLRYWAQANIRAGQYTTVN